MSPIDGQVVSVVNSIPDNQIGQADKENNWGNYVLLHDKRGFYVLICHLKQNSIRVKPEDYVVKGTVLGLCGNSGYSPQPHIHVQVQLLPNLGAPTVSSTFSSYVVGDRFFDVGIPKEGETVEPVFPDKGLFNRLNLLIDQEMEFLVNEEGKEKVLKTVVKMAQDGTFYLTDGLAKLYFGIKNSCFYFYHLEGDLNSPLKYFLFAAPKIPLLPKKGIYWKDYLPLISPSSKLKREFFLFISSFKHNLFEVKVKSSFVSEDEIQSDIVMPSSLSKAKLRISNDFGFEKVEVGKVKIERKRRKKR
ncbi:MAG: M23 family metallopeptidase [Desulfurobacteriaceae bacterium]